MAYPSIPVNVAIVRWNMDIRGWTGRELARRAGVGPASVSRMLTLAATSPDTLAKVSKAFRESSPETEELVGYELLEDKSQSGEGNGRD